MTDDRSRAAMKAFALCIPLLTSAAACAESARVSTGASQASAASAAGISGAASFAVGTVVPGPLGTALQDSGSAAIEESRRLGRAAGENLSGPLPVTPRTFTVGPRPDQALRQDEEAKP